MLNDRSLVDLIERAHSDRPYCDCGRETTLAYRDGWMWLNCMVLGEPVENRMRRIWSAVDAPNHVSVRVIDVPAPASTAA